MKLDLTKAKEARIVLISGSEETLRRSALKGLLESVGPVEDDFDSEVILADQKPVAEWIGSVSTVPFMSDRRTMVVRNVLRVDPKELKGNPLTGVPETGWLILVADDEAAGGERKSQHTANEKLWTKLVQAADGVILTCTIDEKTLVPLLMEAFKERGKKLSKPAADLMVEMVGGSYSRAFSEIDKLVVYVGDAPEIRLEDIRALVSASREWNIWAMVDAVRDGRVTEAVKQIRILVGSNTKIDEAAQKNILPQVSRYVRLVMQARILHENRCNPGNAPARIAEMMPSKPNIITEKGFVQQRIMQQAPKVTIPQCVKALRLIADADAQLKGALPAANPLDTLERMLIGLSETLRSNQVR
jgi:DNA polymerase-3 subunit delta